MRSASLLTLWVTPLLLGVVTIASLLGEHPTDVDLSSAHCRLLFSSSRVLAVELIGSCGIYEVVHDRYFQFGPVTTVKIIVSHLERFGILSVLDYQVV